MDVQIIIEEAIRRLTDEFAKSPYIFFTEADAVARFHQILAGEPAISRQVRTKDGFEVSLVHREYPTFFRFSDENPTARLESPASRGHYDTVILNRDFVTAHSAATVINRDIKTVRDESITPFQAVIEFKLDNKGWSSGRTEGIIAELGKLHLSDEAPLRYLIVLMRYNAPSLTRWHKYWPKVKQTATDNPDIASVFIVQWLTCNSGSEMYYFGNWSKSSVVS